MLSDFRIRGFLLQVHTYVIAQVVSPRRPVKHGMSIELRQTSIWETLIGFCWRSIHITLIYHVQRKRY